MKTTNHILLIVAGFILLTGVLNAQTFDLQIVQVLNNGTNYDVKVQIKANTPTFKLGSSNLVFTYNTGALSTPTLLTAHNFDGVPYNPMTVTTPGFTNKVSINIDLGVINNGTTVELTYMDVATVRFTTTDPNGSSSLTWFTGSPNPTNVFKDDNPPTQVAAGSLNGLNDSPLPVQLVSFTASANLRNVELRWGTATEVRNYGFEVERRRMQDFGNRQSSIGNWQSIGFVAGVGTSNSPKEYTFSDNGLAPGRYAYRIKQIDNDGTFEYFHSAEVEVGTAAKVLALEPNYPNPFNPSTKIEFTLPENGPASLKIYNTVGQEVATLFNQEAAAGRLYQVTFDGSQFSSGVYYYTLDFNNQRIVKKMMLVK